MLIEFKGKKESSSDGRAQKNPYGEGSIWTRTWIMRLGM